MAHRNYITCGPAVQWSRVHLELAAELGVITDINVGRSFGNIKVLGSCCGQARCSREFPWTFRMKHETEIEICKLQQQPLETGNVRKLDVFQEELKGPSVASKEVMCTSGGRAGLIRLYTSVGA